MKKIVSDHLAAAFFEKRITKKKNQQPLFYLALICCVLLILFLIVFVEGRLGRARHIDIGGQHILLERHDGPYVLNFNFPDATTKVEALVIDVPDMGLSNYRFLKFSARLVDVDFFEKGTLCVGLTNRRNETSSFYISDINRSWKKIKVPFTRFDKIHDWSGVFKLSFTLEEWNQSSKKGKLLVDGLEFSKN